MDSNVDFSPMKVRAKQAQRCALNAGQHVMQSRDKGAQHGTC
jgi:hypothetical protein